MWFRTLILSALMATSAVAAPVSAPVQVPVFQQQWLQPAQDRRGGNVRPLREVVAELRARYGGRLVGSETLEQGGRVIYVIHWEMPDGSVRVFREDASR